MCVKLMRLHDCHGHKRLEQDSSGRAPSTVPDVDIPVWRDDSTASVSVLWTRVDTPSPDERAQTQTTTKTYPLQRLLLQRKSEQILLHLGGSGNSSRPWATVPVLERCFAPLNDHFIPSPRLLKSLFTNAKKRIMIAKHGCRILYEDSTYACLQNNARNALNELSFVAKAIVYSPNENRRTRRSSSLGSQRTKFVLTSHTSVHIRNSIVLSGRDYFIADRVNPLQNSTMLSFRS